MHMSLFVRSFVRTMRANQKLVNSHAPRLRVRLQTHARKSAKKNLVLVAEAHCVMARGVRTDEEHPSMLCKWRHDGMLFGCGVREEILSKSRKNLYVYSSIYRYLYSRYEKLLCAVIYKYGVSHV